MLSVDNIFRAKIQLSGVALVTPLSFNARLSEKYRCRVFLKREDLQVVRSYKIRGAYYKMSTLDKSLLDKGVVCASAGNHAQGVAFACQHLQVHGKIFMPAVTPSQKVDKVKFFGKEFVEVILWGDTYDDAYHRAMEEVALNGAIFIPPFDDERIMEGQGTVGLEILDAAKGESIDAIILPIGGGGLLGGVGSCFKQLSPKTTIIGVEPQGAPAMFESLKAGEVQTLHHIDNFVDGAAVRRVGDRTFSVAREVLDDLLLVPEGKVCSTILQLYNEEGIVVEPAGALTLAALDMYRDRFEGKTVVCVISGSNNDITRTEEIRERSLLYEGLKHYFIIRFPQRAGALREFLNNVLGPTDDITYFEYTKKHNRASGPAMVGIQVLRREDYDALLKRMDEYQINYQTLNDSKLLFELLV